MIINIEFELAEEGNCLLGIHLMDGIAEDLISGETEFVKSVIIGFLIFHIVIYF